MDLKPLEISYEEGEVMCDNLYESLLEFELDYDIYDTSEYNRTINHVKKELETKEDIKKYIEYYEEVLDAENEPNSELNQKLKYFIKKLNYLLKTKN